MSSDPGVAAPLVMDEGPHSPSPPERDHVAILERRFGPDAFVKARKWRWLRGWERTLPKSRGRPERVVGLWASRGRTHYAMHIGSGEDTVLQLLLSREAMEAVAELYDKLNRHQRGRAFYKMLFRMARKKKGGKWEVLATPDDGVEQRGSTSTTDAGESSRERS